jgi:prepilin-type N-terminal cleavage/methylation domain-containing protein
MEHGSSAVAPEINMDERQDGFTLIELLIAIVVVGILAAVAIVGIAGLTNTGSKSSCKASADAANAAAAAFYANQTPNAWPTGFGQMVTVSTSGPVNSPAVLTLANGVTVGSNVKELDGNGWKLVGTFPGATTQPTFDTTAAGNCGN